MRQRRQNIVNGTHHPTQGNKKGDNGRGGGDKNSGKWSHVGRQWETIGGTMGDNGRQWETRKTSRRRTHHPTQAHISRETMGDNWGRQGGDKTLGKADAPQLTKGNKGRQDPREGGRPIQQREARRETMRRHRETRPLGRRAHHSTPRRPP